MRTWDVHEAARTVVAAPDVAVVTTEQVVTHVRTALRVVDILALKVSFFKKVQMLVAVKVLREIVDLITAPVETV